jgi:hypothetical protein
MTNGFEISVRKPKRRNYVGGLGIDGRPILK